VHVAEVTPVDCFYRVLGWDGYLCEKQNTLSCTIHQTGTLSLTLSCAMFSCSSVRIVWHVRLREHLNANGGPMGDDHVLLPHLVQRSL
jgi:hypothetical protein